MAENALTSKIQADADARVAEIAAAADAEVAAVEAAQARDLETMRERMLRERERERAQRERVTLSRARQAGNIRVQAAKRACLDDLFATVFAELRDQPAERYVVAFSSLTKQALPEAVSVARVRAPEARLPETQQILTELGIDAPVSADDRISAGLMIEAADGVYDCTLDRKFAEARPQLEAAVAAEVLG